MLGVAARLQRQQKESEDIFSFTFVAGNFNILALEKREKHGLCIKYNTLSVQIILNIKEKMFLSAFT